MRTNQTLQAKVETTTHYWGYRELSGVEMNHVSGGDYGADDNGTSIGGEGDGCGFADGYGGEGEQMASPFIGLGLVLGQWDGSN